MPREKTLLAHLDPDWQRAVENARQAARHLWAAPAHRHVLVLQPSRHGTQYSQSSSRGQMMQRNIGLGAAEEVHVGTE